MEVISRKTHADKKSPGVDKPKSGDTRERPDRLEKSGDQSGEGLKAQFLDQSAEADGNWNGKKKEQDVEVGRNQPTQSLD